MGKGNRDKGSTTTTTPGTTTSPPGSLMNDILSAPGKVSAWIAKRKKAETYGDKGGGNPCHYQTHVGDSKKNRQGSKRGSSLHYNK